MGWPVGGPVGGAVGWTVGWTVGCFVGCAVGFLVGRIVGCAVGENMQIMLASTPMPLVAAATVTLDPEEPQEVETYVCDPSARFPVPILKCTVTELTPALLNAPEPTVFVDRGITGNDVRPLEYSKAPIPMRVRPDGSAGNDLRLVQRWKA